MKLVRTLVFIVSLVLLAVGYALSQLGYFHDSVAATISGSLADFAVGVNLSSPIVEFSALLLLIACVVFPFVGKADQAAEK